MRRLRRAGAPALRLLAARAPSAQPPGVPFRALRPPIAPARGFRPRAARVRALRPGDVVRDRSASVALARVPLAGACLTPVARRDGHTATATEPTRGPRSEERRVGK